MSDSLADIFRDIARHDLLTLVRKYPGWSHPAAELIRSSDPANPAQKNLINRLLTAQSQQSIKPNLPVLAALEKLTPRKDGSYAEITRVISLWQKGTNSAENITWLQAWQDTQKGLDALTGFQQQQSYADSYVFFNSAWQSGFRSPELLLTYGRRNPGKNIQSDYGVWQQAAWMASPASVSDLIRLAESSEQYDAVPGFAEKLALQFPGSAVANWWASDQLNDINRTESEKYASFALSLSPWHPVIRKQAKKAQLELPDYIDNSQYLVEVIRPALAYWTLTSNYLQDRASSVSPDLTSGHLLRVETPENFEVQFKLALDESTLRPVQINYLADHLQKQQEIAMVKPDQLNHNLSKEIEARTLNQVNRILGQLQTEMYQSYSQFATEYAGHCLANCKWFTANQ